jgi:hypothetical protein
VIQGGWPEVPAAVIDAEIATITGASDKVIRATGPPDWLLAVDFQTGHDALASYPTCSCINSQRRQTPTAKSQLSEQRLPERHSIATFPL